MKKILLMAGISAINLAAFAADVQKPMELGDAFIQKISDNGKWAVSCLYAESLTIYNLENGEKFSYEVEDYYSGEEYYFGIGKCISDNGILVGGQTSSSAEYWKNGEWYPLEVGEAISFSNSANAITPDGSRICGMLGIAEWGNDDDVLMVVPCIWNAEGDGYGDPVMLPYPKYDILNRVPMYVKAIDISADGKTVIGEVKDATGRFNYPILYKENSEGEWAYEIPYESLLKPEGFELPENPGNFTDMYPSYENYMTYAELQAYNQAVNDYYDLGDWNADYPTPEDFMTPENAQAYAQAMAEYNEKFDAWNVKWTAYSDALDYFTSEIPSFLDNSVRIASDGKSYGSTISWKEDPWDFWAPSSYNVWVFGLNEDKVVKYNQQGNLTLTYLADGGIGVASTPIAGGWNSDPSNSFILKDGEVIGMYEWMNSKVPANATWMKENMVFEYEKYDENWEPVVVEELMTGHATSNPDLSVMALSVQNIGFADDYDSVGYGYVFDLNEGSGVAAVSPAAETKTIFDLYGRQLKEVSAPGIYIINGEKKVVK